MARWWRHSLIAITGIAAALPLQIQLDLGYGPSLPLMNGSAFAQLGDGSGNNGGGLGGGASGGVGGAGSEAASAVTSEVAPAVVSAAVWEVVPPLAPAEVSVGVSEVGPAAELEVALAEGSAAV
jgi:hypothetical protein